MKYTYNPALSNDTLFTGLAIGTIFFAGIYFPHNGKLIPILIYFSIKLSITVTLSYLYTKKTYLILSWRGEKWIKPLFLLSIVGAPIPAALVANYQHQNIFNFVLIALTSLISILFWIKLPMWIIKIRKIDESSFSKDLFYLAIVNIIGIAAITLLLISYAVRKEPIVFVTLFSLGLALIMPCILTTAYDKSKESIKKVYRRRSR